MAYVYRHIRLDKNEPFYIGIGKDEGYKYKRAYEKANRKQYWKNIVIKAGYSIEILMDDISWEFAKQKEKEFIKLYGRVDLGTGSLTNLTDGGDGNVNGITKETREKMAAKLRGRSQPEWQRKILSEAAKKRITYWCHKPVYQFSNEGEFIKEHKCILDSAKELGIKSANIQKVLYGERDSVLGYIFEFKDGRPFTVVEESARIRALNRNPRETKILNTNNGIIYGTVKEAALNNEIKYGTLKSGLSKKGVYKNLTYLK